MGEKDLETWTHLWQTEMETWGQEQNRWMEECGGVNSVNRLQITGFTGDLLLPR